MSQHKSEHGHAHGHVPNGQEEPGAANGHSCCHGSSNPTAQTVTDPVCGMKVDPASAAGSHEHGGVKYYFCSANCLAKFKADPQKYLMPVRPADAQPVRAGAQYSCPMHPEIVRDAPGDCPICGMALVPIAGTGEADDSELRDLTRRFWLGAVLSIPLVILAMAPRSDSTRPLGWRLARAAGSSSLWAPR